MKTFGTFSHRSSALMGIMAAAAVSFISLYGSYRYYYKNVTRDVIVFLDTVRKVERGYIESIPLYEDYATPLLEQKLRTYLFPAHREAALRSGIAPVKEDSEIPGLVKNGTLVTLETDPDKLYYFYNVRDKYRVLAPHAARGR